jgi:hypothetical protein
MGLFGPFVYKTKGGKKFWLHMKEKGKAKLYYFSKEPAGALNSVPGGFEVVKNPKTGFPFLKKKVGGGIFGAFKSKKSQPEKPATEKPAETA